MTHEEHIAQLEERCRLLERTVEWLMPRTGRYDPIAGQVVPIPGDPPLAEQRERFIAGIRRNFPDVVPGRIVRAPDGKKKEP